METAKNIIAKMLESMGIQKISKNNKLVPIELGYQTVLEIVQFHLNQNLRFEAKAYLSCRKLGTLFTVILTLLTNTCFGARILRTFLSVNTLSCCCTCWRLTIICYTGSSMVRNTICSTITRHRYKT